MEFASPPCSFEERRLSGLPDPDPGFRHFPEPTLGAFTMIGTFSFTVRQLEVVA